MLWLIKIIVINSTNTWELLHTLWFLCLENILTMEFLSNNFVGNIIERIHRTINSRFDSSTLQLENLRSL